MTDRTLAGHEQHGHVIWAVRNYYPELGGGSERFRRYLPGLNQRGVDVSVLCTTRNPEIPCGVHTVDGTEVERIWLPNPNPVLSDLTLAKASLKKVSSLPHPKGLHIQFAGLRTCMLPSLWRLKLKGCSILQVATILGEVEPQERKLTPRQILREIRNRLTESVCSKIIVSSEVMAADRRRLGASRKQIQIISNGVNLERFSPADPACKAALRKHLGIPEHVTAILYIGGLTPRKRVDWIIRAFLKVRSTSKDAHLYLVGPFQRPTMHDLQEASNQTDYFDKLKALAGEELDQSIFFTGETDTPESWFRAADMLAFASTNEGLGNVLLEAMACGLPVVTTPFTGRAAELGEPGKDYVLSSDTPESLSDCLNGLVQSPDLRSGISKSALLHVKSHHDLETTLDQYAALYRSSF